MEDVEEAFVLGGSESRDFVTVCGGKDAFIGNIHRLVVMIAYKIVCPNS